MFHVTTIHSRPNPGRREKISKAFVKPFETPQRSVKQKFKLIFSVRPGLRRKGLKINEYE